MYEVTKLLTCAFPPDLPELLCSLSIGNKLAGIKLVPFCDQRSLPGRQNLSDSQNTPLTICSIARAWKVSSTGFRQIMHTQPGRIIPSDRWNSFGIVIRSYCTFKLRSLVDADADAFHGRKRWIVIRSVGLCQTVSDYLVCST